MPYPTNADLPPSVRSHLPEHAQDIYREAFNHAFAAHAGEARQEEAAHRIAWAAVNLIVTRTARPCQRDASPKIRREALTPDAPDFPRCPGGIEQ